MISLQCNTTVWKTKVANGLLSIVHIMLIHRRYAEDTLSKKRGELIRFLDNKCGKTFNGCKTGTLW